MRGYSRRTQPRSSVCRSLPDIFGGFRREERAEEGEESLSLSVPGDIFLTHGEAALYYAREIEAADRAYREFNRSLAYYPKELLKPEIIPGPYRIYHSKFYSYFCPRSWSKDDDQFAKGEYAHEPPDDKGKSWLGKSIARNWKVVAGRPCDLAGNVCEVGTASRVVTLVVMVFYVPLHVVAYGVQVVSSTLCKGMKNSGVAFKIIFFLPMIIFATISIGLHIAGDIVRFPAAIVQWVQSKDNYPALPLKRAATQAQEVVQLRSKFVEDRVKFTRDAQQARSTNKTFLNHQRELAKNLTDLKVAGDAAVGFMTSVNRNVLALKVLTQRAPRPGEALAVVGESEERQCF